MCRSYVYSVYFTYCASNQTIASYIELWKFLIVVHDFSKVFKLTIILQH